MAEAVRIPFEGENQGLKQSLLEIRDLLIQVRDGAKSANDSLQKDAQKSVQSQEQFNTALTQTIGVIAQLNKQSKSSGAAQISSDFDKATDSAEQFGRTSTAQAKQTEQALKGVSQGAQQTAQSGKVAAGSLQTMRQRANELLASVRTIPVEQKKIIASAIQSANSYEQLVQITQQLAAEQEQVVGKAKSLRQQLFEAKTEAAAIKAQFGETPEFDAAIAKAGRLENEIENINKSVRAFNPGQKFAAFGQVLQSIAGAGTAVQGVIGLIGDESEDVQKTLLKVQSALAITQGLNAFFGGFSDGLKNVRALLLGTTKAQVASTVATEADVVAKGAQTTANAAAATSTATLTASVRAFTASLLTNPIFLAVAALTALGAILLTDSDNAKEAKQSFDALLDSAIKFRDLRDQELKNSKELRDAERDLQEVNAGENLAEQAKIRKDAILDEVNTTKLLASARKNLADVLEEELNTLERSGKITGKELEEERAKIVAIRQEAINLSNDAVLAEKRGGVELAKIARERVEQERANAQERKKIREQLAKDLVDIEKQIADLLKQQNLQQADPVSRVELQRQADDAFIDELEKTLKRKVALIQIEKELTTKAFQELTEAEKEARADAAIAAGQVVLDPTDLEKLNKARLNVENKFFDDLGAAFRENSKELLAIQADNAERERQQLELDLEERAIILRKAGATEKEILEFQRRERKKLAQKQAQEAIDFEEQIGLAKIDAQERQGETSKEFERKIELEKLAFREQIVQARIAAIIDDGTKETAVLKASLEAQIAAIRNARRQLLEAPVEIDLFDLLGFKFTDEQKQQVLTGLNQVVGLISAIQSAAAEEVQQSISATDQIISDRERRLDDLRGRLDQELELNKQGFANNVDLIRQQIAEEEKAAEADKARRKSLLEDQKKIARQQLAIDAIVQASQLATAATKVFGTEAIKGIPGIIGAIGFIASMLAAFVAFKARARAIANEGQGLYEGTTYVKRGKNKRGRDTVPTMLTEGEAVIPVKPNKRFAPLVEGLVENDLAKVQQAALEELLSSANVRLDTKETQLFIDQRREISAHSTVNNSFQTKAIERRLDRTTDEIRGLREDMAEMEVTTSDDGSRVVTRGSTTSRIRR